MTESSTIIKKKKSRTFLFVIKGGGIMVEAGVRNNLYGEIMEIKNDGLMAQVTM